MELRTLCAQAREEEGVRKRARAGQHACVWGGAVYVLVCGVCVCVRGYLPGEGEGTFGMIRIGGAPAIVARAFSPIDER